MIEKLECTCIEAYTTRKMRDPNCCACSCDHNDLVEQLAKANEAASFYKEQYENMDRECTKLSMREAKANERVNVLEKHNKRLLDCVISSGDRELNGKSLNKFAIEQKIDELLWLLDNRVSEVPIDTVGYMGVILPDNIEQRIEQLRKEAESEFSYESIK